MLNDKKPAEPQTQQAQRQPARKPNEHASFHLSGFLKITDPETGEVKVQMRAD
jgi:hypothetical protein